MGIFGIIFDSGSPMPWELGDVPGRTPGLRLEDIYDITQNAEANYPESVWAPPPDIGRGPASEPYPEPYEFKKRELVAACRQAMKWNGMGKKYPRPWTINNEATDYMAFPILPGQRLWAGEKPGRFRIVYNKFDGSFYRVVMHRYTTPLAGRESAGLALCWDDAKGDQESFQSGLGEHHRSSKSPPHISHALNDTEPHPLRQNPTRVKSPALVTSQSSSIKSPPLNEDTPLVKSPTLSIRCAIQGYSQNIGHETPLVQSPLPTYQQLHGIQPPRLRQETVTSTSPHPPTSKFSTVQSPTLNLETNFVTSPPVVARQFSGAKSPVVGQAGCFVKSSPTTPYLASNTQSPNVGYGYDPRLPRSPRMAGNSSSNMHSPVLGQKSPILRSPPMTPHVFTNIQSHITGYDPRLPRSPRSNAHPFNSSQSPVLGQETPLVRSPAVGMHPSRFVQSPVLSQGPCVIKSPRSDGAVAG